MNSETIFGLCMSAAMVWVIWREVYSVPVVKDKLAITQGQLAAANREIAMMRKARSDASRKGAVTKRAKRIHLPGGAVDVSRVMGIEMRGGGL